MRRVDRVDESLVAYSANASGYLETAMHELHCRHINRIPCRRYDPEVVPSGSVPCPTVVHASYGALTAEFPYLEGASPSDKPLDDTRFS
jgi:hypothetical protein